MNLRAKSRAFAASSILCTFMLAGCGGGGTASHAVPATGGGGAQGDSTQSSTEQYVAQGGLDVLRVTSLQATASLPVSTLAIARKVESLRKAAASAQSTCTNGETESWSTSGTVISFTIDTYYDSGCTQLWQNTAGTFDTSQDSFNAAVTTDSLAGSVIAYETLNGALTLTAIALQGTEASSVGGTPFLTIGMTCSIAGSISCGAADIRNLTGLSESLGVTEQLTYTTSLVSGGGTTTSASGSEDVYTGSLGGLSIGQGSGTAWTVSGGTQVAALSATLSEAVNASNVITAFNVTESDTAQNTGLTLSLNGSGGFNGTITELSTGTTAATFTVDQNGDGTITYANGTTAPITDYIVT
ncbi:MAG TPA: hypothetical protein VME66_02335 [Candidatus Acidoferrales bacterium]|nr:hypothetical protein [Candidatus Acidoferrales bacterium]